MAQFQKGNPGRPKGAKNKSPLFMRDRIQALFDNNFELILKSSSYYRGTESGIRVTLYTEIGLSKTSEAFNWPSDIIYDPLSLNLIKNSPSDIPYADGSQGYRIWAGVPNAKGVVELSKNLISYKDIKYDHAWNISSNNNLLADPIQGLTNIDATNEIILFNGKHVTRGYSETINGITYNPYITYSNISSSVFDFQESKNTSSIIQPNYDILTSTHKLASYVWMIDKRLSKQYNYLRIQIEGVNATIQNINNSGNIKFIDTASSNIEIKEIEVRIRFEDDMTYDGALNKYNIVWLNPTLIFNINNYTARDAEYSQNNFTSKKIQGCKNSARPNYIDGQTPNQTIYIYCNPPSINVKPTNNIVYLYVTVRIPAEANFAFTNIKARMTETDEP